VHTFRIHQDIAEQLHFGRTKVMKRVEDRPKSASWSWSNNLICILKPSHHNSASWFYVGTAKTKLSTESRETTSLVLVPNTSLPCMFLVSHFLPVTISPLPTILPGRLGLSFFSCSIMRSRYSPVSSSVRPSNNMGINGRTSIR